MMHIRRFPLSIALAALAALLLAPAALAGGAASAPPLMDWTGTQFTASDGAFSDKYGQSVAIDGDTAVVGSPYKTVDGKTSQGAVYVYTRSGGQWTLETMLAADDGAAGDQFGTSVSLDNDTIAAGAPLASDLGAVYLYTRAGEGWAKVAKLAPGAAVTRAGAAVGKMGASFGQSVSLSNWVLAVGAPWMDGDGAAYVYKWVADHGAWDLWATLTSGEATDGHRFGWSVSLDADDDLGLAVGAPGDWDVAGAVYLFDALSDVWSMHAKLTEPEAAMAAGPATSDPAPEDEFGLCVSLKGDVLAVGSPYLAIQAPAGTVAVGDGVVPGAAYIYHRAEGAWSNVGTLTPENPEATDGFGASVAVSGEVTVLVGSPGRDVYEDARQGVVYAYDWTGQIYQGPYQMEASSGGSDDWLGTSLAVSEGQVLSGAPGTTVGGNIAQGAAWLFTLPAPTAKALGYKAAWQDEAVRLRFRGTAPEGGAAVDHTLYRVGSGDWTTGTSLRIARQGVTTVEYRAVDIFGTIGAVKTVNVRIDTRRPRVIARKAAAKAGAIVRMTYKVADPRPSSGTARVRVVVKNAAGKVVTRSSTIPVKTNAVHKVRIKALRLSPGTYRVLLHAVDRAGNEQKGWSAARLIVK